tara:strand:- start:5134 stop:6084 length:951 start_codon:yes stop_codon:yes gene_type:complete
LNNEILGDNNFQYKPVESWAKLPKGFSWKEVASVAIDSDEKIYVFNRGAHPIIIFDKYGNFLNSWGEGLFVRPHGLTLGPDNSLFCIDDGDHTVRKCTLDGDVLFTIGSPNNPAEPYSGNPFNRCTDVAIDPKTNDIYISDGYMNAKIHVYSAEGKYKFSWGTPGVAPGEFNIPHNIAIDKDSYVYVADRENHRVQIFNSSGEFEGQWNNIHRPCALYISSDQEFYIGELGWGLPVNRANPNIGPRISVLDSKGNVLSRIGHLGWGLEKGQFLAPHGISLDKDKNIYLGEVSWTNLNTVNGKDPGQVRSFQKLIKV